MDSSSKEMIQDLLNSCLLPQLREDLDSIPIEKEHFKSYHECLQIQLPLLYDWVQQQKVSTFDQEGRYERLEQQEQEIQSSLIILLCELSAPESVYKLDRPELVNIAERILDNFPGIPLEVQEIILKYYQNKLHKDVWKRQLGAVHGFVRYLKFLFLDSCRSSSYMNRQYLMFCLSVALNIRSYYETHYKLLSTNIFLIMLNCGSSEDILSMNIHGVIYDAVFKDLHIMDSIPFIEQQWSCLLKCFDFYTEMDSFTWNKLDDSLEILLRNIPLAPNSLTSIHLMKFVSKFVVYFNINRQEFEEHLKQDLLQIEAINSCRQLGGSNTSYTTYRWAKTILEMFILESYRLMQSTEICQQMLMEIHRCYMVTILPIRLTIIEPHLVKFLDKFTVVLMEVVKVQKYKEGIIKAIAMIFETFCYHLSNCENLPKLVKFNEAYHSILQIDVFKKYKTIS